MYPFERFTEGAKQALTRAQEEAVAANQRFIGTEHLALALSRDDGVAGRVLADLGVTYEGMKAQIGGVLGSVEKPETLQIIPTSRMKRVMELAFQEATSAGAEHVATEHLLVALLVADQLGELLRPRLWRRVQIALQVLRTGEAAQYLHDGYRSRE